MWGTREAISFLSEKRNSEVNERVRHRRIPGQVLITAGMLVVSMVHFTCKRFEPEQLVIVETGSVSGISHSSCQVSGEVYDAGAGGMDQHGFVWSKQEDPQLEDGMKSELGSRNKTGSFTGTVSGLSPGTIYYIRAYGTAGQETVYGKTVQVTTSSPAVPTLVTAEISSITDTSAVSGGNITDDGGVDITARGVCWDTSPEPTLNDSLSIDGNGSGQFTSQLGRLSPETRYYLRAYASNSVGTAYGQELEFTTVQGKPELPVVTTEDVVLVTDSSAISGGDVTEDGGSEILARGICWSIYQQPTTMDDTTLNGAGTGLFSSSLTGLMCNTTYFVRAYVTNSLGTAYGAQKEFTTEACPVFPPEVVTVEAYDITDSSAFAGGNVTDDGGASITARGVCWGIQPSPGLEDFFTVDGSDVGSFTSTLSKLDPQTTYHYRAYASNEAGTEFGDEFEFTTKLSLGYVVDIDGNMYRTVEIGEQTWMAENLRVSRYADGTALREVEDQSAWGTLTRTDKSFCAFDFDTLNYNIYGALYTWAAAMNGAASSELNPSGVQGACPDGWHLPSEAEWLEMEVYLGMTAEQADSLRWRGAGIGTMLKDNSDNYWKSPSLATNEAGFGALPGGHVNTAGYCTNKTIDCYFWSATDWGGDGEVWYRHLWYDRAEVYRYTGYYPQEGYSVRCVKNE